MLGYFPYTHIEPEVVTIKQLFQRPDLRDSYFVNLTPQELLDQTFLLGTSDTLVVRNRDLIFRLYTKKDQVTYPTAEDIDEDAPIRLNTIIYTRVENIKRDLLFTQTLNVEKTYSTNAFVCQKLKELMSNPDYVRTYSQKDTNIPNKLRRQNAEVQVFIWCRGLIGNEKLSEVDVWRTKGKLDSEISIEDLTGARSKVGGTESGAEGKVDPISTTTQLEGSWIDITPFIENLKTSVSEGGGNFSFSLSPVVCTFDKSEGWILDPYAIKNLTPDIRNSFTAKSLLQKIKNGELKRNQFFFHTILSENDLVYIKFEPLKLEEKDRNRLKQQTRLNGNDIPSIVNPQTKKVTQERVYDMIGMIDVNSINFNFSSNDIAINIQGRDLVKTIIEDGTYFFPSEFAQGMFLSAGDADLNNSRLMRRVMFTGQMQNLSIYYEKTIQTVMQFIITQLSNTGFVPDSVFYGYRDRRNSTITLDSSLERRQIAERQRRTEDHYNSISSSIGEARLYYRDSNLELKRDEYAGLIKSVTDNQIRELVLDFAQFLIDTNIALDRSENSEFSDFYLSDWKSWLPGSVFKSGFKATIEPASTFALQLPGIYPKAFGGYLFPSGSLSFREELGKRKDGTSIIYESVRQSLSHAYAYLKLKSGEVRTKTTTKLLQGVWQIIDLVIDKSVRNRILVDTSISQDQGSLINTINKVCQRPLVEFMTDTYGDRFVFMIRKPPTDRKTILGMIYGENLSTENDQVEESSSNITLRTDNGKQTKLATSLTREELFNEKDLSQGDILALTTEPPNAENTGIIIDIDEGDIVSENLTWYNNEVFSWYRIIPKGYLWGTSEEMTWAFLPAIYFEEYSDIWGNKPYIVTITYLPLKAEKEANAAFKQNPILVQSYYDLKYIIDSNAYLPFTREGTITLANGDRRIKRGIWIRHKGTGEVYYVDGVGQTYNSSPIDRSTTIQVSRGMVEKFLKPQTVPGITEEVSYFNIINTRLQLSEKEGVDDLIAKQDTLSEEELRQKSKQLAVDLRPETVLSNFRVNKPVFDFFLRRQQNNDI